MKKSLLFMAVLLTAGMFVSAQESYSFIAEDYCQNLGLAEDDIALTPDQVLEFGPLTFTAQDNDPGDGTGGWKYKPSTVEAYEYNGVTYKTSQVQGQKNGKNGYPYYDGAKSACAIFTTTEPGNLDIAMKTSGKKRFWIIDIPTADLDLHNLQDSLANSAYAYQYGEGQYYWGGFFDENGYYQADTYVTEDNFYQAMTINLVPDHTYYVFVSGSKLMLSGFTFTSTVGVEDNMLSTATVVSEEYYTILGQKLTEPERGALNIIVKTMSDGTVKTDKVYIEKR